MMYPTSLNKAGKPVVNVLLTALLDLLHIKVGARVGLAVGGEQLAVKPQQRPRYTLDELLGQCDPSAEMAERDCDWLGAKLAGTELV